MSNTSQKSSSLGPKFQRFCRTYLKNPWTGEALELEAWMVEWANEVLRQDENGHFVYREALLGVARKNGKTLLTSALCLFFLFVVALDHPSAEIYALAGAMHQARVLFDDSKKMLLASSLADYAKVQRDAIYVPDTGAIFRVIPSGRPELLHGRRPLIFVGDEVHAWNDAELWHAMHTAQISFPSALGIGITTAGFDLHSLLGDLYKRGVDGTDPRFYFKWYSASNPDNPDTWKEANPSSFVTQEALERESKTTPPFVFRRLHLNLWTRAAEQWLPPGAWDACASDERIEPGESVYVGLDLGFKEDHTAVVEVARRGEKYITRSTIFATHADPSKPAPLATHVFNEERQSHQAVLAHILEISGRNPITELVYDPYGATLMIEELEARGITCVEFPQSHVRMTKATDLLYNLVVNEKIEHDGDPAYAAHIAACTVKWVGDGLRLDKTKDRQPMDSGIALALAATRAHESGAAQFNAYFLN